MNGMSLHPYPKGAPTGCQISIPLRAADHTFGSKSGSQNGAKQRPKRRNEMWSNSEPILGPYLAQKWVSHRRISLLPAHVVQADLRPDSLNMNVNSYLFSLCVPSPVAAVKVWTLCRYWGWDRHQENKWTKWEVCLNCLVKGVESSEWK